MMSFLLNVYGVINLYCAVTLTLHLPGFLAFLQYCQQQVITMAVSYGAMCAMFMLFVFNSIFFVSIHCNFISVLSRSTVCTQMHMCTLIWYCGRDLGNKLIRDTCTCVGACTCAHSQAYACSHAHNPHAPQCMYAHTQYISALFYSRSLFDLRFHHEDN